MENKNKLKTEKQALRDRCAETNEPSERKEILKQIRKITAIEMSYDMANAFNNMSKTEEEIEAYRLRWEKKLIDFMDFDPAEHNHTST